MNFMDVLHLFIQSFVASFKNLFREISYYPFTLFFIILLLPVIQNEPRINVTIWEWLSVLIIFLFLISMATTKKIINIDKQVRKEFKGD